jgi:hypothetical protein
LKVTELAAVKLLPLIVTLVPTVPFPGVKEETVGAGAVELEHEPNLNDPIRVFQLSCSFVVGFVS